MGVSTLQINGDGGIVQPVPLVNFSMTPLQNKLGKFGSNYSLTISGAIVFNHNNKQKSTKVLGAAGGTTVKNNGLEHILHIQNCILKLLDQYKTENEGLTVHITDANSNIDVLVFKRCKVESVNFEEGTFVNICRYSITLSSDALFTGNAGTNLHSQSMMDLHEYGVNYANDTSLLYMLEDFTESWEISPDDQYGTSSPNGLIQMPRSYTISRTVTAVGKAPRVRTPGNNTTPAWLNASNFLTKYIYTDDGQGDAENGLFNVLQTSLTGHHNAHGDYRAFNHSRTEQIDKSAGSVTATDNWVLANSDDSALETFEGSVSTDLSSPFVKVSVNGTLKGLGTWAADAEYVDGAGNFAFSPIKNAQDKYNVLSNFGKFGITCPIYKRANSLASANLNSQPLSVTIGRNEISGEITYSMEFDNRPTNYFSHVLSENVQISDTYPGDQFAVVPVIGRAIGPILQFTFGRTEYRRSLSIDLQLDYTDIDYTRSRTAYVMSRPSCFPQLKDELNTLIASCSPASEPGVRKYFVSPPQESWSPKDGKYSIQLEWTYEMTE